MAPSIEITPVCKRRFSAAFTLIELMITISVAAILVAVAAPSFQSLILNARLSGKKNEFIYALNFARSTALAQNSSIVVCPYSAAGSTFCGASWNSGWIIKKTDPSSGVAALIKQYQSSAKDPVLSAVAYGGPAVTSITFDPVGLNTTQSNFTLCDSRSDANAVSIQVLLTGLIQAGPPSPATPPLPPAQRVAIWGGPLKCP